ncbi:MAG: hypothetical protein AAF715_32600 [Myxococcota bacterium]
MSPSKQNPPPTAGKTSRTLPGGVGDTRPVALRDPRTTTAVVLDDEPREQAARDAGTIDTPGAMDVPTTEAVSLHPEEQTVTEARRRFRDGIDESRFTEDDLRAGEELLERFYANKPLQEALAAARAELKPGQRLGEALGDMMFGPEGEVRDVQESDRKESVVVTAKVQKRSKLNNEHRNTILEATKVLKEASPEALQTASVSLGLAAETSFVGKATPEAAFQVAANFFDAHYERLPKTVGGRTAQLPIPEAVAKYTAEKQFTDFAAGPNPHRNITGTLNGAPSPVAVDDIAVDGRGETPAAVPEATGSAPGRRSAPTVPDVPAAATQGIGTTPQAPEAPSDEGAAGSKWAAQAPPEDAAESIDPAVFPSAMAPEIMTTAVNLRAPALDGVDDGEDALAPAGVPSPKPDLLRRLKPFWYTLVAIGTVALIVILFREFSGPEPAPVTRQPQPATPPPPVKSDAPTAMAAEDEVDVDSSTSPSDIEPVPPSMPASASTTAIAPPAPSPRALPVPAVVSPRPQPPAPTAVPPPSPKVTPKPVAPPSPSNTSRYDFRSPQGK